MSFNALCERRNRPCYKWSAAGDTAASAVRSTPAPVEDVAVEIYPLAHVSDGALLRDLTTLVAKERGLTAAVLAHIAEVDARKLYPHAAHPSM